MKPLKNIVQTGLLAAALTAPVYAEETQTAQTTTQTNVANLVAQNGEKVAVKHVNLRKEKTKEELAEEKRLDELREFVKDKKIEKNLITKRKFGIKNEKGEMVLDVEKAVSYLRKQEKLAQQVEKDFLIVKGADMVLAGILAERAIIQEEGNKYQAEADRLKANAEKIIEESNAILAEIKSNLPK